MISKSRARLAGRLTVRRMREREGLALAEGPRVVIEALRSPLEVLWVLMGEALARTSESSRRILAACRERGVECQIAPDRDVAEIASTERPQPALACVRAPQPKASSLRRGRHLMPIGVQIPGNLGTLIRSAWAFGLDGIVIGRGTVDPWSPKVIRASAGGIFHLPLLATPLADAPERREDASSADRAGDREPGATSLPTGVNLLCADPAGTPVVAGDGGHARDWVLAVGGETQGLPGHLVRRARTVSIPVAPGVDSLNVAVAGSILMYLLTRDRR